MCQSWEINSLGIFKKEMGENIKHVKHLKEKNPCFSTQNLSHALTLN